jgi:hypothetical protein
MDPKRADPVLSLAGIDRLNAQSVTWPSLKPRLAIEVPGSDALTVDEEAEVVIDAEGGIG